MASVETTFTKEMERLDLNKVMPESNRCIVKEEETLVADLDRLDLNGVDDDEPAPSLV